MSTSDKPSATRQLPEPVADAVRWLNEAGRSMVADQLAIWAEDKIDAYVGLTDIKNAAFTHLEDAARQLDAIAEVIGYPKESWRIAGCDTLAHVIADLQRNYIALRDRERMPR